MAKANSLITLQGTHDGITFVKSPTYGNHVRAARGTHKKAKLNQAFQKQSQKLVKADLPAQILKNAIDPYRQDFRYGQLWQDLVSMTNSAMGKGRTFDFSNLRPFEIHPKYPLGRLFNMDTDTAVDPAKSKLQVTLSYKVPPTFDELLPLDGYRLGVIVIFPDLKKQSAKTDAVHSNPIGLTTEVGPLVVEFFIPRGAKSFLVCVRVDGWERGELCNAMSAKGMKMVAAGRV
jgi:hypothetical protein